MNDTFQARSTLTWGGVPRTFFRLGALAERSAAAARALPRMPFAWKVLLENLLRHEDGELVTAGDVEALAGASASRVPEREIAFMPSRVLMQDFTGVPAVVDLAAMRDAVRERGGDPRKVNPLQPVELVIDHSVQVDAYGEPGAFARNASLEYERNAERYAFLKWGQGAFENFKVVPPETGICHQVNLEHLARTVMERDGVAFFDTVFGTDSHTTMINGLGVLGWGVGGIEAEAAMLGQPCSMLIPEVVGVRLRGALREGSTATDLVLRVTELLRKRGVVGKFVEFFGPGVAGLPLADRATIANMAPEYGATCGLFPVDAETLRYLRFTGRSDAHVKLVEAYCRAQGCFSEAAAPEAEYTDVLELDLTTVEPSLAGPKRPQDRVPLSGVPRSFHEALPGILAASKKPAAAAGTSAEAPISHGSVVIAAITSCTNTSNPSVMVAAGLVAKKAVERGLTTRPWVKTSLAPGSKVVTDYLDKAGLTPFLDALRFHCVGYGCTTCIGNSGPLEATVARAIDEGNLVVAAVLSGNRNFEGRVHAQVRANYLASPPLVVAYALAGRIDVDFESEPLGKDTAGRAVFLRDLWPTQSEVARAIETSVDSRMFVERYRDVYAGDAAWRALEVPEGATYAWDGNSTYVKSPPYFVGLTMDPPPPADLRGARILAIFGDSITTDHISPAGSIKADSPAGRYLQEHGVEPSDFNSYGARRGNHEVMVRGTFANVRLRNRMVPGTEGGVTVHVPSGERMAIYDAAMRYASERVPLVVLAGKEYGSGSSRDWAAKGPALLGVRAVIAESFERIHRSNLVGMGVLPLEFVNGATVETLGLDGSETLTLLRLGEAFAGGRAPERLTIEAEHPKSGRRTFEVRPRLDTPRECEYYRHGGILAYVVRGLLARTPRGRT